MFFEITRYKRFKRKVVIPMVTVVGVKKWLELLKQQYEK